MADPALVRPNRRACSQFLHTTSIKQVFSKCFVLLNIFLCLWDLIHPQSHPTFTQKQIQNLQIAEYSSSMSTRIWNTILPDSFTRSCISSPQQTKVDHIILWTETNLANVFSYGEVRAPGSLVSMRFSLDAPVEGHLGQPVTALMNLDAPVHKLCSECCRTPNGFGVGAWGNGLLL